MLAISEGELSAAATHFGEAAAIYNEIGALGDLAYISTGYGDYATAQTHYAEALARFQEAGNQRLIGRVLGQLARIACRQGDLAGAAQLCIEALKVRREIGHNPGMVTILDQCFVELAIATRQFEVATRILGAVATARQTIGRPRFPIENLQLEPILARLHEQLGAEPFGATWAEGEKMSLEDVTSYALDALSTAAVA
jgi:tetratricopeptide (TPR) repeat protein